MIDLKNQEAIDFLSVVEKGSVDLVLIDPPYVISRESGMDKWTDHITKQNLLNSENIKTEEQWDKFSNKKDWDKFFAKSKTEVKDRASHLRRMKKDYLKYGSIYGTKYAKTTDFGQWDRKFTLEKLAEVINELQRVMKPGATAIIFFDKWKITNIKEILEENKFKQLRIIEWVKTNPQPINSKRNYLSNCTEFAVTVVKGGKPCFNSEYDNGIYKYPIPGGKDRIHDTQKSLPLFEELINKHSNEGDLILDCFAGSATTAIAAMKTNRNFIGCELEKQYYHEAMARIEKHKEKFNDS
jgi:DNA modification methylase